MHFKDKRVLNIKSVEQMESILNSKGNSIKDYKKGTRIKVYDKMQSGYSYILAENPGENLPDGFEFEITPDKMLSLGIFEGHYANDCILEYPREWFLEALKNNALSPSGPNVECNYFKVKSRMSLQEWQDKGWIPNEEEKINKENPILSDPSKNPDVRGIYQWALRLYLGRRIPYLDEVQIKRWKAFRRHSAQVKNNCKKGDLECRPKQRQALLQWGMDPFI